MVCQLRRSLPSRVAARGSWDGVMLRSLVSGIVEEEEEEEEERRRSYCDGRVHLRCMRLLHRLLFGCICPCWYPVEHIASSTKRALRENTLMSSLD